MPTRGASRERRPRLSNFGVPRTVMAGLVLAIHVFVSAGKDVDARRKAGQDGRAGRL
jgi:hypothetical protein